MTIKALYRPSEQKLRVEVLNATNLIPLDSNGGCGWAGQPHCPRVPCPWSPVCLGQERCWQCLDSLWICFFIQGCGFGEKGRLLHWFWVVQWDVAGRTMQGTVPTSHCLWHKPAARAGGFSSSCKAVADKKIRRGEQRPSRGPAVVWGTLQERSLLLQPPLADRCAGRIWDVPAPSRSPGWAGGCGEAALTPPCSHPSVSKPPRLGSLRGRGARGGG